jgi:hypothetical protein
MVMTRSSSVTRVSTFIGNLNQEKPNTVRPTVYTDLDNLSLILDFSPPNPPIMGGIRGDKKFFPRGDRFWKKVGNL